MHEKQHEGIIDATLYAFGHVEGWLEAYARSVGVSQVELTHHVANVLLAQAGRQILGPEHHMPTLRRASTKRNQTSRSLALASSSHSPTQKATRRMSAAAKNRIRKAQKARWKKWHQEQAKKAA